MVYCGRPSKACPQCRQRNLKCDKKRDSCGQCVRARLACLGYHDPKAAIFRDQTKTVIQKNIKSVKPAIPSAIIIPVEEQAKQLFVSQYVLGASPLLDYIQRFYPNKVKDVYLVTAIQAVGLVFFSSVVLSPSILQTARIKYGHALSLTNKALQSPELATNDTMLLTVLLLDLFENLATKDDQSSLESATKHIDGAITLVKLRGDDQFNDPIGLRMFLQLNLNVITRCLQREVEMPADFVSLRTRAFKFVNTNDPKWRFSELMTQYAGLRNAMRAGDSSDIQVLQIAREIDGGLLEICAGMPSKWSFTRERVSVQSANVFGDYVHVYPSHSIRKIWNTVRLLRIILNEVIEEYHQRVFAKESSSPDCTLHIGEQEGGSPAIQPLMADICASIPQYTECNMTDLTGTPSSRAGAHTLIFPLYIVASSPFCSDAMRGWIAVRLELIGHLVRMPQAIMVKDMVERAERGNPWAVAAMLGSLSS